MSRQIELLEKIALRFADMNYIDSSFTVENNVSADDMISTFNAVSNIINGYLKLPESDQVKIQLLGVGIDDDTAQSVRNGKRMRELIEKLKANGEIHKG